MFSNFFKIAWRNLVRNKFYSIINIGGLAIGLAVGIMILLWVQDEYSYDGFHRNAGKIYKINSHLGKGGDAQVWEGSPAPLAVFCRQSIPQVVNTVRVLGRDNQLLLQYGDKKFTERGNAYVDSTFFSVFDFKFLKGNPANPFPDNNSIVLTASMAGKYFGDKDPIGKVIVADGKDNFVVTGVMEDFPDNSSMRYNVLFPMSLFAKNFGGNGEWKTIDEDLGNYMYNTYLELQKDASPDQVAKKITDIYWQHRPDQSPSDGFYSLQSLKTLHLVAADGGTSALQTVRIFLFVALLILFIACINYVNLSTARSMIRAKEVSVRKIIGAERMQLFCQFMVESILIFLLASIFALLLIGALLPLYNNLSGKHLLFSLANPQVWIVLCSSVVGTLLMAGIYPAVLLSSFRPVLALKGKLSLGIGNSSFRKILVVTQFVFSIGLIIGTIVIGRQLKYIREKDLGYNNEHVFSFGMTGAMHDHYDAARNELLKRPGISGVASSDNSIVGVGGTTGDTWWDGKEKNRTFLVHVNGIDQHFIPLLNLEMVDGKNFAGTRSDSAHFILNETAIKQAGIKDPIDKKFKLWQTEGTITGVVKDFNYASLKEEIEPVIFYYQPPNWKIYIKTTGKDAPAAIAAAQKVWKSYSPDFPFEYSFLDEDYNKLYLSDQKTGILFNVFAIVAIVISCLGLFGLATFTAQVKTKEIGIRKVLGASIAGVTRLLAREFITLVLVAFLIAAPVAWWAMNNWLQDFAYRVTISWWIFIAAGVISVLIALLTVGFQAVRAAIANPVKSLRME